MTNFYPLKRGDRWFFIILITFAAASFLPWFRRIIISGMALFGWLMAALMVLSPLYIIIRLLSEKNRKHNQGMRE